MNYSIKNLFNFLVDFKFFRYYKFPKLNFKRDGIELRERLCDLL